MRIDLNYIRKIMLVFLESEKAYITFDVLQNIAKKLLEKKFFKLMKDD